MKLGLRHLASATTLVGLLLVPGYALAQGGDTQPQPKADPKAEPKTDAAGTATGDEKKEESSSGPTVTLGTTASGATKDTAKKKEEKKEEEQKLPWAGTLLAMQTSMSTTSIARQQQATPTDLVETFFLFTPRYTINKSFTVRGRFTMVYEWTDNVSTATTTRNEPQFGDSIAYLDYTNLPEIPGAKIKTKLTAQIAFPTSKASIQRTQIISPGLGASFSKTFDKVGKGSVSLGAGATWSHALYQSKTPGLENPTPYNRSCFAAPGGDSGSCATQISGTPNPENVIAALFSAGGEWPLGPGTFQPSAFLFFINTWDYQLQKIAGVGTLSDYGQQGSQPFKQSTYFSASLGYTFWGPMKWLELEVGYYMFRALLDGNGRIGNPIFDPMQDTRLFLSADIAFDELYNTISGKKTPAKVGRGGPKLVTPH